MGSEVELFLEAGEIGWVQFGLSIGDAQFSHRVSDLTDALGDLARAAVQIVCGGHTAECIFNLEPGDLIIHLDRGLSHPTNPHALLVKVIESRNQGDRVERFSAICSSETFGEAVRTLVDDLFGRGAEAFHDRWDRPFPVRARAALHQALATPGV